MPSKSNRSTEHEISFAVLQYLATIPHGEAAIDEIKAHLPKFIKFTDADMEVSTTRRNEMMWEQQVRNIVSHRSVDGNFIGDGLLSYSPGRLAITESGRNYLARMA
ncbi:hypothetical protein [Sphingosinicella microcystinivorans]|uniref:Restriction system protein Mrr-like N-terminal domain-containing protein n=1 Tax=Sphingosinicella microcystinivorans TaxID=335406 RepID=A0AAD1D8J8_SPHMI|nr:hypothetical protein [Sphingosinicella microcystinivorans]BBE35244.1 hypothetical protein SmB9_29020 [Sphingosinicella microcystinivorans]